MDGLFSCLIIVDDIGGNGFKHIVRVFIIVNIELQGTGDIKAEDAHQ